MSGGIGGLEVVDDETRFVVGCGVIDDVVRGSLDDGGARDFRRGRLAGERTLRRCLVVSEVFLEADPAIVNFLLGKTSENT